MLNKIRIQFSVGLTMLLQMVFVASLCAQQVSGVVINAKNHKHLEDVNVLLNPGNYGTTTNAQGEFNFENLPNGLYKLSVSIIGFKTKQIDVDIAVDEHLKLKIDLDSESEKIDEVRVQGNYTQTKLLENPIREQASLMASVSSITQAEIEKKGAITLVDALKNVSGGWVETRGRKVKQFFSIRGQKYPYPSYSINGIWQKEFDEIPYFFNSSNIEEIKIIRSSSALLKSLSALTGVVDVKTKKPGNNEVDLFAKYGSLNSYNAGAAYGNTTNNFTYRIGVNGSGTKGPESRNGKENVYNVHGFFDWKLNDKLSWSANLFYLDGMRQLVQPTEPADAKFMNRKEDYDPINSFVLANKLRYKSIGKYSGELHVNYAHRNPKYHNENLTDGKITEYYETDWELTINQVNAIALNTENTLRFGALYNYWIAPDGKRFYSGKKAEVHTISGVVTDQHNFGKLLFDAGFRLTQEYYAEWGGFNIEGSGGKFSKVDPIIDEWQSPVWQATSGLSYSFTTSSSLHFTFACGIVNPRKGALNEADKKPENENRTNFDLGFVKNVKGTGEISATTFIINRKKAIEFSGGTIDVGDNEIMELYRNTDKRNYGIELELKSLAISNLLLLFSNLTLMKGEIELDGDWVRDDEMPNFIANAGISFQKHRIDANGFLNYTGKYKNNRFVNKNYLREFGKAPLGNYTSIDCSLGYRLGRNRDLRIFAEAKNLLNQNYQTVPGYPDFGRIIFIGVQIKI